MIKVKLVDLSGSISISSKETTINGEISTLVTAKGRIISIQVNENWTLATILYGELS